MILFSARISGIGNSSVSVSGVRKKKAEAITQEGSADTLEREKEYRRRMEATHFSDHSWSRPRPPPALLSCSGGSEALRRSAAALRISPPAGRHSPDQKSQSLNIHATIATLRRGIRDTSMHERVLDILESGEGTRSICSRETHLRDAQLAW